MIEVSSGTWLANKMLGIDSQRSRYWSNSEHSYSPEALLMSRRTFDALSASDKELVLAIAAESVPYMRGLWDKMEAASKEFVLNAGINFNEVDRAAFHRAARPVLERYLQRDDLRALYDLVKAAA